MDQPSFKILPPKVAAELVGVCGRTISAMVDRDQFPRPVRVSANRIGFLEHEVTAWISQRIAERDAQAPAVSSEERVESSNK